MQIDQLTHVQYCLGPPTNVHIIIICDIYRIV